MVQNIPRNLVKIFDTAGVDLAILAGDEWCCGFPLIGAGIPDKMQALKEHNVERVKALGAAEVVFTCPSCLQTWKEFYHTDLRLYHSTQFLERLIQDGSLSLNQMSVTVTYHDPCDLGRQGGVFESPRRILKAVPGVTLVELGDNRAKSVCCGGGGNLEMADAGLSGTVAQKKIEEIQKTGAQIVVTSCQQCVRTIKGRARRQKIDLDVVDITEFVLRALKSVP
jgi:heterodisulfide reductase subunit D